MNDETIFLECECHDFNHTVRISLIVDEEEIPGSQYYYSLYFDVGLSPYKTLWERIVIAWKYIFKLSIEDQYLYGSAEISDTKEINKLYYVLKKIVEKEESNG